VTAGNMAIGASNLPADGYYSGFFIGRELHAMGINMNFAPTVDLYLNPYAHVIGPRAFSDNPVQAASLAVAFFHGLADAGIICTAKHFPGHGNTDMDSHTGLPVISTDFATLWDSELVPYRFLIREGLPAIMSGHIAYPVITGDSKPASLSPRMLTGVLREKLNFGGIIITDDLQMEGVMIDGLDQGEIALAALKAGNDMVMISRGPETHELIRKTLLRAVREDPVFKTSVRQSVLRILEAKLKWIKKPGGVPLYPDAANLKNLIPDREGKDYFLSLAGRSATVFRDEGLPFSPRKEKKVLLVGQYDDFLKTGKTRIPWADSLSINYNPFYSADKDEVQRVKNRAKDYDTVVFCLANPRSLQILKGLKELGGRVIVLSVLTPVYLREVPWVSTAIAVYGTGIESFQAGFAVIMGDFKSEGRPPFTMPPFP
ncbi:MAG: glycoside hydrolase family 3 protein, partial [Spirochaetales bacterium]